MRLYHGTHINALDSILESGIKGNKAEGYEVRGSVFATPRADVAFGYASMFGGELNCSGHVTDSERVLLILDIDENWYKENFVRKVDGSVPEISFKGDIPANFIVDFVVGDRKQVYSYL